MQGTDHGETKKDFEDKAKTSPKPPKNKLKSKDRGMNSIFGAGL